MPIPIALSGLMAATTGLKTTANNVANAGTSGFRPSRTEFAEVVAASQQGEVGSGVRISRITRQASGVDLAEQLLRMIEYANQFEAQANVIRTAAEDAESVSNLGGRKT